MSTNFEHLTLVAKLVFLEHHLAVKMFINYAHVEGLVFLN